MKKLFVEQAVEIKAPPQKVWKTLTDPELTEDWIKTWWPEVHLESDWKLGSEVLWKTENGTIGSRGVITFLDPEKVIRFTFQVSGTEKKEEITFVLHGKEEGTRFSVSVGDFGDTPEHEACYPGAVEAWERSLPVIKHLAENL